MGVLVSTLVNLGYGLAWRVLDAQYFGVAQRRRRVFIVGCAGDAARARAVLLVGEGGGGDPPARREAGEVPAALTANGVGTCGADDNQAQAGHFVPAVSHALCAPSTGGAHLDHNNETLIPVATHAVAPTLTPSNHARGSVDSDCTTPLAFHMTQDPITSDDMSPAIGGVKPTTGYSTVAVQTALAVRRLTPLECLRLQGFPDGWLDGLGLADSVKYRCIGNAVAVPVVEWIARRMLSAGGST